MARSKRLKPSNEQEAFAVFGKPAITPEYDINRARKAAQNRRDRRSSDTLIGELALNKHTTSFMQRVEGLWIPYSKTESSTVIDSPEATLDIRTKMVRRAVIDKYEQDETVTSSRVRRWAYRATSDLSQKFDGTMTGYILNARFQFVDLCSALSPEELSYDGDSIRSSKAAMNGMRSYLITLRSFVGANVEKNKKRKWIQDSWVHQKEEANQWATGLIDSLPDRHLEPLYDEAVYNSWSREMYWQDVKSRISAQKRALSNQEPRYEQVPIEVYEQAPENFI
jgi:hypothetical protein